MLAECAGALSLGIWIYLVFARGGFWRMRLEDMEVSGSGVLTFRVAAIVPARNEARVIGESVQSLLRQNFSGDLRIYLVDDHSSDDTVEAARLAAEQAGHPERLVIIPAGPLPEGWTGKVWALSEGVGAAESFSPDYYWFTDADITHEPDNLGSLLARAREFDLVSLMVKLRCQSPAERLLIPAFVFFFFKLYPPTWIAFPEKRTAAAAGGCILIRPEVVTRNGGIAAIRDQLIDDCALARAVKREGGRIWLGITTKAKSVREYGSFRSVGRMISRTAFTQLSHSSALLALVICAMTVTYLLPVLLSLSGRGLATMCGLTAWLLMTIAYWPTVRFYGLPAAWALLLPVAALFYMGATIFSAVQYWSGRGGIWKERVQDLADG